MPEVAVKFVPFKVKVLAKRRLPVPPANAPDKNDAAPVNVVVPDDAVKLAPLNANVPLKVTLPDEPVNVPAEKVALPKESVPELALNVALLAV